MVATSVYAYAACAAASLPSMVRNFLAITLSSCKCEAVTALFISILAERSKRMFRVRWRHHANHGLPPASARADTENMVWLNGSPSDSRADGAVSTHRSAASKRPGMPEIKNRRTPGRKPADAPFSPAGAAGILLRRVYPAFLCYHCLVQNAMRIFDCF